MGVGVSVGGGSGVWVGVSVQVIWTASAIEPPPAPVCDFNDNLKKYAEPERM